MGYTEADPLGLQAGWNRFGYVGANALNFSDTTGLIKWTGSFGGGGVIAPVGASYYRYDLTSECVNGKKARVQGYALGGSAGVGLTAAGSTGGTVFEDNETTLHPAGFNGRFAIYGAGFALGKGRPGNLASESALNAMGRSKPNNGMSWSDVVLGNARTAEGSNFSEVRGIDFSASFTAGSSIVTSITYMDCICPN